MLLAHFSTKLDEVLQGDLGIAREYRHASKFVTPGKTLEPSGTVLKWYALYQDDQSVPDEITQLARV